MTADPDGIYKLVRRYALALGLKIGARALRARLTPLDHDADIAKVREWLGHANRPGRTFDVKSAELSDAINFA